MKTAWPNPDLRPLEKKTHSGEWNVFTSYEDYGKSHEYSFAPKNEGEYKKWEVEEVLFTINNLGGIHDAQPLR
jgi:hypothetical protein